MPQITVAAINGGCAGAGFAWASACDLRVAASTAKIAVAFLEVGVSGEMGAGWTLTRMLGSARARELYLLPSKITADVALDIGLVSRVFPTETFADDVDALVTKLSLRDPVALRLIKANLVDAEHLGLRDYIAVETERHRSRFEGDAATRRSPASASGRATSAATPADSGRLQSRVLAEVPADELGRRDPQPGVTPVGTEFVGRRVL